MRFEDLEVWKRSTELCVQVHRQFRQSNDYGFRDQITRAAVSIPSNIAEGSERCSQKECVSFLSYAKGSCGELKTQVHIAIRIGYLEEETGTALLREAEEISHMIGGLIKTKKGFTQK